MSDQPQKTDAEKLKLFAFEVQKMQMLQDRYFKIHGSGTNDQEGTVRPADQTQHPSDRTIQAAGDTKAQRTQGSGTQRQQGSDENGEIRLLVSPGGEYRWPAPPGRQQETWEAPRLVAGMDCTVNGYNFREDLLRMVGNAVVHQTAAKAYIDLLSKFDR